MLTFLVKKSEIKLSGVSIFLEYAKKNLKSNVVLVVVLVLESKGSLLCRGVGTTWVTDKTPAMIGRFNLPTENLARNSSLTV